MPGTVNAGGYVFGTDKIIHFINVGRIYHGKYEYRGSSATAEKEAASSPRSRSTRAIR